MANIKITDLTAYTDPESTDVLPIVDVTNDETKKVSIADLMENAGAGAEATPGIAFNGDPNTGIYSPGADQIAISTGGAQRLAISDTGAVTIPGNLTVQGTTTFIDSQTLQVEDKNIEMGVVTTPTDTTADGGGITLKGATDKTLNWVNATDSWTSSENVDLASGKTYKINGTDVLSATALGSAVQISSDNIPSGTIVNDDVNASAAIAGTKIDPDFGSQTVETTGVFSAAGGAQATPSITFTGDLNTGIYSPGADQVAISTGGTGRLFIDSSGRVGVGTTPSYKLDVNTDSNGAVNITDSTTATLRLASTFPTTGRVYLVQSTGSDGGLRVYDQTASSERMRIDSSGRVGVGTSSPTELLDIDGDGASYLRWERDGSAGSYSTITSGGVLRIGPYYSATDRELALFTDNSNNSWITTGTASALKLGTNKTARITISSTGNVGVGTTSPVRKLHLHEAGSSGCQQRFTNVTTGTGSSDGFEVGISSGEAAQIWNYEATDMLFGTNSTERLRIDSSGRVGIGTSSPGAALDIDGTSGTGIKLRVATNTQNKNISIANAAGSVGWTFGNGVLSATKQFVLYDNDAGAARILVDSSGRVGIGTTVPLYTLEAASSTDTQFSLTRNTVGRWLLGVTSNDSLAFSEEGVGERARIDSSGRLLVGTSTARTGLGPDINPLQQVEGTSYTTSALSVINNQNTANQSFLILGKSRGTSVGANTVVQNNDTVGEIRFVAADGTDLQSRPGSISCAIDGTPGADDMPGRLVFSTTADGASSPTERMRIGHKGEVFIGVYNTVIGEALHIQSQSDNDNTGTFLCQNTNTNAGACSAAFTTGTNSTATSNALIKFGINGYASGSGQINANGTGQCAFGSFSDERLKENIIDLPSQWENIKNLRPVEFDFIESQGGEHQIGFIAQEFENVYPDAVGSAPMFVGAQETSDEERLTLTGWAKTEARLVKALQEAIAKIETLEAKVAALEAN